MTIERPSARLARSPWLRALVAVFVVFGLAKYIYSLQETRADLFGLTHDRPATNSTNSTTSTTSTTSDITPLSKSHCNPALVPQDTVIIVKTGANEIYDKLPTELITSLSCYDDVIFFSDLAQQLGPHQIHDVLDNVLESVKQSAPEFEYYRLLQEYHQNEQDIASLRKTYTDAAWKLDKFKFVHMLEKTWKMQPNRTWYVFIEADTYLVQTNLGLWLQRLDPTQPLYIGSAQAVGNHAFAHGGSGFMLSGAAFSQFAHSPNASANLWDEWMLDQTFGDDALTRVLESAGLQLTSASPMLGAQKPLELSLGPGSNEWCQPIVTMHHITADEASRLWAFEQNFAFGKDPILLRDLYQGLISDHMRSRRDDWNNYSEDMKFCSAEAKCDNQRPAEELSDHEQKAHLSFDYCREACDADLSCYQLTYSDNGICALHRSFRLGEKELPDEKAKTPKPRYQSAWKLDRILRYRRDKHCAEVQWSRVP